MVAKTNQTLDATVLGTFVIAGAEGLFGALLLIVWRQFAQEYLVPEA